MLWCQTADSYLTQLDAPYLGNLPNRHTSCCISSGVPSRHYRFVSSGYLNKTYIPIKLKLGDIFKSSGSCYVQLGALVCVGYQ